MVVVVEDQLTYFISPAPLPLSANYPTSPLKLLQTLCSLILKFIPALYVTVQAAMIMIIVYNEIKCVIVFLPIKAHSITVLMERQMARAGCRQ